jgi:hypothetical protein
VTWEIGRKERTLEKEPICYLMESEGARRDLKGKWHFVGMKVEKEVHNHGHRKKGRTSFFTWLTI